MGNYRNNKLYVELDMGDVAVMNEQLHDALVKYPNEYLPMVEAGAREALAMAVVGAGGVVPPVQVLLRSESLIPTPIRNITVRGISCGIS